MHKNYKRTSIKVYEWATANNMHFNDSKFELVRYGKYLDLQNETLIYSITILQYSLIHQLETLVSQFPPLLVLMSILTILRKQ